MRFALFVLSAPCVLFLGLAAAPLFAAWLSALLVAAVLSRRPG